MRIDWFDFWLILSGVLLSFLVVSLIFKFSLWYRFKHELKHIKKDKIKEITAKAPSFSFQEGSDLLDFKKEMDVLMKEVYFESYDRTLGSKDSSSKSDFDLEENLERLLDGKILDVIKEKELLLAQKDSVLATLEEKNQRTMIALIKKVYLILLEKDKLLKEKDSMIEIMKKKLRDVSVVIGDLPLDHIKNVVAQHSQSPVAPHHTPPTKHAAPHHADFLDVNA